MRVLITRPEQRAEGTADKLEALGHNPVLFPLFEAVHDPVAVIRALAEPHSALAVTSAEAIRALQPLGSTLEPHLGEQVFAVGRATARAALEAGFVNVIAGTGGGHELGRMVVDYFATIGQPSLPVLYLAGARRMGRLERVLAEHGIGCVAHETYSMEPIPYSLEQQQAVLVERPADAVFFYSREAADTFFGLEVFKVSRDALRKTLFFCLSPNIAEAVPHELKNSAVVSLSPDEDELIDLL
jgi:uroporphyrinogen-III synthase